MRSVVIFGKGTQVGWSPITQFADLAARCFDADLHIDTLPPPRRPRRLLLMSGRRRPRHAAELCLVIAAAPDNLADFLSAKNWFSGFRTVIGLVTDSYWTDEISLEVRRNRIFDHIFITGAEELPEWQRQVGRRVSSLPWGSDVLGYGSAVAERPWDILRVGRQPPEWNDDNRNSAAAAAFALSYHPRPAGSVHWKENQAMVMAAYASAKFLLAFSNVAHQSEHTHPFRQYITGRWTDALAGGAVVAGIPPRAPGIDALLWPEALLDLGTINLQDGLVVLREAVSNWSPDLARLNHLRALERLDWRWRLADIASTAGLRYPRLDSELDQLRTRIAQFRSFVRPAPAQA